MGLFKHQKYISDGMILGGDSNLINAAVIISKCLGWDFRDQNYGLVIQHAQSCEYNSNKRSGHTR